MDSAWSMKHNKINNKVINYDFVIIANSIFSEYHGKWDLQRLVDWHNENDTLKTYIINLSTIYDNSSFWVNGTWGDGNSFNPFKRMNEDSITEYEMFNDSTAKIRNYLRYASHNLGVKYALLVGDTDSSGNGFFPVRYVYARGYGAPAGNLPFSIYHEIIPTDVYYACLNGTFNADEDVNSNIYPYSGWGENATESEDNIEECDWEYEIAVGRFPVDNIMQLENCVRKTIIYMNLEGSEEYLYNITPAGHYTASSGWGFEWGADYSKSIDSTLFSGWLKGDTTYGFNPNIFNIEVVDANPDRDEGVAFTDFNARGILNNGCHIWYQSGHGDQSGWHNAGGYGDAFTTADIQSLINTNYVFVVSSIPCNTANFDNNDDSFIEQWITDQYGAFAAIGNTRYGWGSDVGKDYNSSSHYLTSQMFDAYFNTSEGYTRLGDCLFDGKQDARSWHDQEGEGTIRWAMYEQILMGSPAIELKLNVMKKNNPEIRNPFPSNGSTNQNINPILSVEVKDYQGDLMKIMFKTNLSGYWRKIGVPETFVGNGTYYKKPININKYLTKYWWSIHVQDLTSRKWTNKTFCFTTRT